MNEQNKQSSKKKKSGGGWIVALIVFGFLDILFSDLDGTGIVAFMFIAGIVAAAVFALRFCKLTAKKQGASDTFSWKNASGVSSKIAESIQTKDSGSDWRNARPSAPERQAQFRKDTGSSFPAYKAEPAKPKPEAGARLERQYYDSEASERIFDRDRQRRLEQLENFLKTGIISREEYKILKSRYEKS